MNVLIQLLIAEADYSEAARSEPIRAPLVMVDRLGLQVLRAIEFDDEFVGETDEVNDVRTDCGLTAEFVVAKLFGA